MKFLLVILSLCFSMALNAQTKNPEYIILIDGERSTQADVEYYAKQGRIKSMNKGVSEEEYAALVKRYGPHIGDRLFIMTITLHPKESYNDIRVSQFKENETDSSLENFNYQIGDTADNFEVLLMDGSSLTLEDLKGKVVLINFWATWCAPCIMEFYDIPDLILEPFEGEDFIFLPVSIGETKSRVEKRMAKLKADGIDFNSGLDPKKQIFKQFAKGSIPKSVVIDKNGNIQLMTEGNPPGNLETIANTIERLLI